MRSRIEEFASLLRKSQVPVGTAEIIEWGTGRKSEIIPEHLQMPLAEQRAQRKTSG